MYRETSEIEAKADVPAELVYLPVDPGKRSGFALQWVILLPLIGTVVLIAADRPNLAPIGFIAGVVLGVWWWRNAPKVAGTSLRVEKGELFVFDQAGRREIARCALRDLMNVSLDTRTVQKVTEGHSAIPAMRYIDTNVGGDVDETRIVLKVRDRGEHALTKEFLSHTHTAEWFGKIRVFLRKHGWVPEDERT